MKKELISVIVPIYMGEQWLPRCIKAIRNQTFSNLEIILVDDGSPDNCGKICDEYAAVDDRVKVVHKENGGLPDARNAGIKASSGEYIMFVDEDDYIHPEMLEILYQTQIKTDADIVVCNFNSVPDTKKNDYPKIEQLSEPLCFEGQQVMNQLYYRNLITVVAWGKLYRKRVFQNHGYIKGRINDDESAIHFILHACRKIAYIEEKLYYYVQREGSITSKCEWTYYSDAWLAYQERLSFLETQGYMQMALWTKEQMLHFVVTYYKEMCNDPSAKFALIEMNRDFKKMFQTEEMQQRLCQSLKKKYKCFIINPSFYYMYIQIEKVFMWCMSNAKRIARKTKMLFKAEWRFFYGKIYLPLCTKIIKEPKLKRYLRKKYHLKKDIRNIVIFGTPNHGNLGDYAIAVAERNLFLKHAPESNVFDVNMTDYSHEKLGLKKLLKKDDLLILTGGGNLGNQYMDDENIRRSVINLFPENKVVLFPQTLYFTPDATGMEEQENTARIYNAHKNLYLTARDAKSFEGMKKIFDRKVFLLPDVVLTLRNFAQTEKRGALLVLREDLEGVIQNSEKKEIELILRQEFETVEVTDTELGELSSIEELEQKLEEKFKQFKDAELVVTDRLHGMIFAAISETPCIVMGTYNHKVEETYAWLEELEYIRFLKSKENLVSVVRELKQIKNCAYNISEIDKYYTDFLEAIL